MGGRGSYGATYRANSRAQREMDAAQAEFAAAQADMARHVRQATAGDSYYAGRSPDVAWAEAVAGYVSGIPDDVYNRYVDAAKRYRKALAKWREVRLHGQRSLF